MRASCLDAMMPDSPVALVLDIGSSHIYSYSIQNIATVGGIKKLEVLYIFSGKLR